MNKPLRPRAGLCALVALMMTSALACAHRESAASGDRPDCVSPNAQRTLTYCVGPAAADLARRNEAITQMMTRAEQKGGEVDTDLFPLPVGDSPTLGPDTAAVTIVMFSDLECPYCARAHEEMATLYAASPKDVRIVFKHSPLPNHPNAKDAARAAIAAHEQGKFWEFAELAYQRQNRLSPSEYVTIAEELGLDMEAWRASVDRPRHIAAIERDMRLAQDLNVPGTPTIFLNGAPLPGGVTAAQLAPVVEQQKMIVDAFADAGVPRDEIYWRMVRAQYQELPDRQAEQEQAAAPEPSSLVYVPVGDSPSKGAAREDALVTIVVFSDFQCPYCREANAPLDAALADHAQKVRVVYKHFPLPFHERADDAAAAAVIAHRYDKFWAFHDLAFANQEALSDANLQVFIEQIGITDVDVNAVMNSDPSVEEEIRQDMVMGVEAGVRGTPTYFVNGMLLQGGMSEEDWDEIMTEQIALGEQVRTSSNKKGEALYEAIVDANADNE